MQFRKGALARIRLVPSDISAITLDTSRLPFEQEGWGPPVVEDVGYLAVEGRADVRIDLNEAKSIWRPSGDTEPVRALRIAADEPTALIDAIERVQSAISGPSSPAS